MMRTPEKIDDPKQEFLPTPADQYRLWMIEIEAAQNNLEAWKKQAQGAIDRFLDKREKTATNERHLNLYTSNVQTLRALLYGKVPNVDVSREFGDANDDVARVSAEILERCLNSDIKRDGDGFKEAIGSALDDRLIPGLGTVRLRYTVQMREREVPPKMGPMPMMAGTMPEGMAPMVELAPGFTEPFKEFEDAETDYVHFNDFLWSPCRTWDSDCRWVSFKACMDREALRRRFTRPLEGTDGQVLGDVIPLNAPETSYNTSAKDEKVDDVWGRAEIWEIWDKPSRKVIWLCEGYHEILDTQDDPLELAGFFPCPRPLMANVTTSALVPVPDYYFAQDQYRELDEITTRISTLQEAVAVRGVCDGSSDAVKQLLESQSNAIIPVKNWGLHAEKGGLKGLIDWLPLEMIVGALRQLEEYRDNLIQQIYQVTGLSDILRGQATNNATATEQSIKAKFASVRLQALQDEVSRFASDVQKIRAEIVVSRFDDEEILRRANYAGGNDAQHIPAAMQLLRDKFAGYRIEIKPENINLADAAALKNERMEFLSAIMGGVEAMSKVPPPVQAMLAETMQWALASFRGSSQIEGAFDRFAAQMQQAAQAPKPPPSPPPQVMVAQMKAQGEKEKMQMGLKADLMRTQADTAAQVTVQRAQLEADLTLKQADEAAAARADARAAGVAAVQQFTGV